MRLEGAHGVTLGNGENGDWELSENLVIVIRIIIKLQNRCSFKIKITGIVFNN